MAAFEYAAKFVCGKPGADELAPGVYFTAINVHNPTDRDVRLRKKIAIAGRREEPGPVSEFFDARLGPDQALEIDRPDIREHARVGDDFLKGFVVLESDVELEVIAVYTAAGGDGQVETIDVKRVPPRRTEGGLPTSSRFGSRQGVLQARRAGQPDRDGPNQGSADAGASTTTVHFAPGGAFLQPTPRIAAGASVDLAFPMPAVCFDPDCDFRIIVDSAHQVTESDETNNTASGTCRG